MRFDIIIKTFERYNLLRNLLFSIQKYYPECKIIIADDSFNFKRDFYKQFNLDIDVLYLGKDVGLSYGRNYAVSQSKNEYILLLDDDFVFDERTDIDKFIQLADFLEADVVGGSLDTNGKIDGYNQILEMDGKTLYYKKNKNKVLQHKYIKYQKSDIVYNFGIFRTSLFKKHKWDENIKIKGEHTLFFKEGNRKGLKVYYCPDVTIQHNPKREGIYGKMRGRNEGLVYMYRKLKINKIINVNRQVTELIDNKFKTYRI